MGRIIRHTIFGIWHNLKTRRLGNMLISRLNWIGWMAFRHYGNHNCFSWRNRSEMDVWNRPKSYLTHFCEVKKDPLISFKIIIECLCERRLAQVLRSAVSLLHYNLVELMHRNEKKKEQIVCTGFDCISGAVRCEALRGKLPQLQQIELFAFNLVSCQYLLQ